jgi:hypothetical protein
MSDARAERPTLAADRAPTGPREPYRASSGAIGPPGPTTSAPVRWIPRSAEPPAFLQDQQLIRVDEDAWDWDRVADVVEKSSTRTFTWRSSDAAKSVVADRLTALEKVAAALPDDPQDEG